MTLQDAIKDTDVDTWWVSCKWATCAVFVKGGQIVWTSALWRKFKGQHFDRLLRWLKKNGSPVYTKKLEKYYAY